jgi:hypothetical protein
VLTHNYTDTRWFRTASSVADAIGFTLGRVKFYEPDGTVAKLAQGQAVFYFGDEVNALPKHSKTSVTGVVELYRPPLQRIEKLLDQTSADELEELSASEAAISAVLMQRLFVWCSAGAA